MSSLLVFFQYIKNSNEDEFFEVWQCFTGVYYIDTDEITGFFLLPKTHIFIERSKDTNFIYQVWGYWCRHGYKHN